MTTQRPLRAAIYLRINQDRENDRVGVDRQSEDAEKRIRAEGVRIMETAKRHNVMLSFIKGINLDLSNAGGRMVADFRSGMARAEIEIKDERQSRAQQQRAKLGKPPKSVRPLGYAINGGVIEHEAEAVKAIYGAFERTVPPRAIARALPGHEDSEVPPDVPKVQSHSRTLMIERNAKRGEEGLPAKKVPDDTRGPRQQCWASCETRAMRAIRYTPRRRNWPTASDVELGRLRSSRTMPGSRSGPLGRHRGRSHVVDRPEHAR